VPEQLQFSQLGTVLFKNSYDLTGTVTVDLLNIDIDSEKTRNRLGIE
jgi:hypothetical protein